MRRLDAGALAVDLRPRIGLVQRDVQDAAAEAGGDTPLAAALELA